jgi:hypothetical protein
MAKHTTKHTTPRAVLAHEALLNITWSGQNGDLPSPIPALASDADIIAWATEALQTGSVPGIRADRRANLSGFVIDRFPPSPGAPFRRVFLRPQTPFG